MEGINQPVAVRQHPPALRLHRRHSVTRRIPLSGKRGAGHYALVDDSDFTWLNEFTWNLNGGYATTNETLPPEKRTGARHQRTVFMHRLILGIDGIAGVMGDHVNGSTLDNRRSNLRLADHAQNGANRRPWGGSRYLGVSYTRGSWMAGATTGKIKRYLGAYETEEDAARAYDYYARQFHGEYARLNFPHELPCLPERKRAKLEEWKVRAIRRVREEAGISYPQLAKAFGSSESAVRRICKGELYTDVQ